MFEHDDLPSEKGDKKKKSRRKSSSDSEGEKSKKVRLAFSFMIEVILTQILDGSFDNLVNESNRNQKLALYDPKYSMKIVVEHHIISTTPLIHILKKAE